MEEVSDIAYDKAVEVVTDTVRQETHKEYLRLVEETRNWVLSPERKAPQKEREYAAARLDGVIIKIRNAMQNSLEKFKEKLMKPAAKKQAVEQIKAQARPSVMEMLRRKQDTVRQADASRRRQARKQDMEL